MTEPTRAQRVMFAISPSRDRMIDVALGVPTAAWEYMKDGKTHTFDLSRLDAPYGLPLRIMLFGAADHAEIKKWIETHNRAAGMVGTRQVHTDVTIRPEGTPAEIRERTIAALIAWVETTIAHVPDEGLDFDRSAELEVSVNDVLGVRALLRTLKGETA